MRATLSTMLALVESAKTAPTDTNLTARSFGLLGLLKVLCIVATVGILSGCGALIKRTVNNAYPPVSLERRQLSAIQAAEKNVAEVQTTSAYAHLSPDQINNYVQTALATPFPLDDEAKKILAAPPIITNPTITFGVQEIAFSTYFNLSLKGEYKGLILDGLTLGGNLDVRFYPELVPSKHPTIAAAVRLRPSISTAEICELDLSKTKYPVLYWFEKRRLLSSAINTAIRAFRDNINGQLNLDAPLPLAPIEIGRKPEDSGKDGVIINPPNLALLKPEFQTGAVEVSPTGLTVVASLRIDALDPNTVPTPQVPPQLPPETLPPQASPEDIQREFAKLQQEVDRLIASAFGNVPTPSANTVLVMKPLVAKAFNDAFDPKHIEIGYTGPLKESGPETDDDKNLRLPSDLNLHCGDLINISCDPRGSCTNYLISKAGEYLGQQRDLCRRTTDAINGLAGTISQACELLCVGGGWSRVCVGDVVNPGLCSTAKLEKAHNEEILRVCVGAMQLATDFLNAPGRLQGEIAKALGIEGFYSDVCKKYDQIYNVGNVAACKLAKGTWDTACGSVQKIVNQFAGKKIGELDWRFSGVGDHAVNGGAALNGIHVSDALDRIDISGVSGRGSVDVAGWAKFQMEPLFYPICPPPPGRIDLAKTNIPFELNSTSLGGAFGIATFNDDSTGKDRNGLFIDPDSFDATAKLNTRPIGELLRHNALTLPCALSPVMGPFPVVWQTYDVLSLMSLVGVDIPIKKSIDLDKIRVGWADSTIDLPISWTKVDGKIQVLNSIHLPVELKLQPSVVALEAGQIPPAPQTPPKQLNHPVMLDVAAGAGTGLVFARTDNVFFSPPLPYLRLAYRTTLAGPFVSYSPGLRFTDAGIGYGVAIKPIRSLERFSILVGGRSGALGKGRGTGTRFLLGLGWDFERLLLRGCEPKK